MIRQVFEYGYRTAPLAKKVFFLGGLQLESEEFFAERRRG